MILLLPEDKDLLGIASGAWDKGAFHRVVVVAREFIAANIWKPADGRLWFHDIYKVHASYSLCGDSELIFHRKADGLHVYHKQDPDAPDTEQAKTEVWALVGAMARSHTLNQHELNLLIGEIL